MGIKSLVQEKQIEVWKDVYDARLDDKAAPDLADILKGKEEPIYATPEEFFKRTYLTKSMEELIEEVAETLKSQKGGAIFLLTSFFGGGKTHTQICLYHAFKNPEKIKTISETLAAKIAQTEKPIIIIMDGSRAELVPHPDQPYKAEGFTIKTIWGMLAYKLGAYAKIKHLDDEKSPAPDVNLIKEILSEAKQPILILMDEIVHYVFNMYKSRLKDYGEKVILFLDYLARAVESTPKTALVASVQAEYRVVEGQKVLLEEEVFTGYAGKIVTVLSRESTRIKVPVSPDDVVKVLQKRIFKKIPETEAWKTRDTFYSAYRQNHKLFGTESDWQFSYTETGKVVTIKDTYPFHPKYIEVLQEFVTRNKDLQKTRDAIRITRKVIRRFLRGTEDAALIMPWHIDLRDRGIRSRVLTESRREFRDAANRDIISEEGRLGSVAECTKPALALRIATAVLLKTYTYETFKEPLKVFPDLKNIALMTYEPETFNRENLQPADIETTLQEMHGKLPHFASGDGRYWFTPFPLVIEHVEKKAAEMLRGPKLKLYEAIKERTKQILVKKERRRAIERGELFNERNTIVIGYGDEIWQEIKINDDPSPKLVVLVKPEVNEEEIRKIILMKGDSGRRTFRNTVTVVCPHQKADFDALLTYAAKITAAEEVKDALAEYYRDKELRNLQETTLKKYIQNNENILYEQILSTLTRIYYPVKGRINDEIKSVNTTPTSSIISQVEAGLKDPATGPKLRTDFSFIDLADFLKMNLNWDLIEGEHPREFRDIRNVFYEITSAPFTTRKAIEQAIIQGVQTLDIGVKAGGKLYWKRIGPENGAELPPLPMEDTSEILPYKLAAEELKNKLIAETGEHKIGKEVHINWYEVDFAGKRIRLEDLITQTGWHKILREGTIIKQEKVIETGFILKIAPSTIRVKPNTEAKATITVEPIQDYNYEVYLKTEIGKLEIEKGTPPFTSTWHLGVLEPGNYVFTVQASGADETTSSASLVVVVESPEEDIDVRKLETSHEGAKLLKIMPGDIYSLKMALDITSKLKLDAKARLTLNFGENIRFNAEDIDVKLAGIFVQNFIEMLRRIPSLEKESNLNSSISLAKPEPLDKQRITAFMPLSEKAIFTIRVEKSD